MLRNVIIVHNIPQIIADEKILTGYSYFGQYGQIDDIKIKTMPISSPMDQSSRNRAIVSVRVTYPTSISASLAFYGLDNFKTR